MPTELLDRCFVLDRGVTVPAPIQDVFPFFADPANLEAITPPWLNFRIRTPRPIPMAVGTLIDYTIGLRGVPMRWRTRITEYDPGDPGSGKLPRFVDEQIRGPYARWRHEHTFEPAPGGSTIVRDRVEYRLKWWGGGSTPLGRLVHRLLVRPDLERIFDFRERAMRERWPGR